MLVATNVIKRVRDCIQVNFKNINCKDKQTVCIFHKDYTFKITRLQNYQLGYALSETLGR